MAFAIRPSGPNGQGDGQPDGAPRCRWVSTGLRGFPSYGPVTTVDPAAPDRVVERGAALGGDQQDRVRRSGRGAVLPPSGRPRSAPRQITCSGPTSVRRAEVELAQPDLGVAPAPSRPGPGGSRGTRPRPVVEQQRRVEAVLLAQPAGVGPRPGRIGGRHQEVAGLRDPVSPSAGSRRACRRRSRCRRGSGSSARTARRSGATAVQAAAVPAGPARARSFASAPGRGCAGPAVRGNTRTSR